MIQFVEGNKVKVPVLSSHKRKHVFPALHKVTEDLGMDFSFTLWGGVFAPADTPENILQTLNTHINQISIDPSIQKNNLKKDRINIR
jgi:tripartite-type tricarboxylate transporter receptor subunit TctC